VYALVVIKIEMVNSNFSINKNLKLVNDVNIIWKRIREGKA
jgi:hypothetical protein